MAREMARDQGQSTPLLVAAVGLVAMMVMALGPVGQVLTDRAQARTAADAAALAGAAAGEAEARSMAEANRAELVDYVESGDDVVVAIEVGGVGVRGRARRVEVPVPSAAGGRGEVGPRSPGSGARAGLAPAMLEALREADGRLGEPVPITSGYRSPARQQALWERHASNPFPVARPGSSLHEQGLAVDVPGGFVDRLLSVADQVGLCQPLPASDPIHFELCGARQ